MLRESTFVTTVANLQPPTGKNVMTDAELLHHYSERERIIFGGERSPGHYRLRELGFIEEHLPVSKIY